MSKRKGLSIEEKRQRLLQLFYEKKDVFQLKDLEKIAPKEKGIISQSVKEVTQSLVDDGLIDTDKIGTSIYFWAFPSKAVNNRKRKLEDLKKQIEEAKKKLKSVNEAVTKAQIGREDTENRTKLVKELNLAEKEKEELKEEIQKYKDSDPDVLESIKKQTEIAKEATNRWTDNVFSIKSWCKKKFSIEESVLNKQFSIPEELDYVE
ncbi:meiotic nuclear division protein 1 homolog isoform X1 [Limulus polyphemus]|uniref:Meiotic nuclear division protein 1 homolog n=1 Tax=Limulus polyphemus TaxID=6850 RepID=A0ABM1C4U9_LIMPO|nr:meiotic nuclear division protein 1 homolog isoform X1 [Limulus polyphemus]XP_022237474.1 meiotic nuclear division protein 1 homolog isoform X1 [Limulus polyphemus]XP_022237475.1 meiotic nuclear division protein 1 homolog isoform X1 [Limulus polyphemus]XP_022237476.1 meiotic nuclear division protein 1 homolog isoform X1 [Limulus polyphemus]XP_022237477.1 meiotic nuclear division protein 1 homolog isoform X1 [Limulus polyphemus]XP_022237478.1 meiotic nuclear division protein 1 homolog isoform